MAGKRGAAGAGSNSAEANGGEGGGVSTLPPPRQTARPKAKKTYDCPTRFYINNKEFPACELTIGLVAETAETIRGQRGSFQDLKLGAVARFKKMAPGSRWFFLDVLSTPEVTRSKYPFTVEEFAELVMNTRQFEAGWIITGEQFDALMEVEAEREAFEAKLQSKIRGVYAKKSAAARKLGRAEETPEEAPEEDGDETLKDL